MTSQVAEETIVLDLGEEVALEVTKADLEGFLRALLLENDCLTAKLADANARIEILRGVPL